MPKIDAELLRALTPGGVLLVLVVLVVWGFISGRIRTAVAIKEVREDRDARLADKDRQIQEWRAAHAETEKARVLEAAANREQLEMTRMTLELVRAIRDAARPPEGGS